MTIPVNNADILRSLIESGRTAEAAQWLELVAIFLPESELVPLQQMVLRASPKRKVGANGHRRDRFIGIAREFAFASAMRELRAQKGVSLEEAAAQVELNGISDPGNPSRMLYKSAPTIYGYYRKWSDTSS